MAVMAGRFLHKYSRCWKDLCQYRTYAAASNSNQIKVSEEVSQALHSGKPVVALETTIITHGMPQPQNLSTALKVESLVRQNGGVPATVGILQGQIHVGLDKSQLEFLADPNTKSIKTSRRDFPYVLSQRLHGGTTVSGTMVAASMVGIPIFVTGGIGGVHRGAESSMDVSADLTELGRTSVTVISAGVKSILDIGRTLEYLETEGVCVATYGMTREFPAFFTRKSGFMAPYNVTTQLDAARLIHSSRLLGLENGSLIGVPIPEEFDSLGQEIETVIQSVVKEAKDKEIEGKEVTPYILQRVNELTEGKSLAANIALIENNAVVGTQIAVELSKLGQDDPKGEGHLQGQNRNRVRKPAVKIGKDFIDGIPSIKASSSGKKVVVVGGVIVDFYAQMTSPNFEVNGATYGGKVVQSFGGVGRNIADGLTRLGVDTHFISAIGNDSHRHAFEAHCQHMNLGGVTLLEGQSTATYCAILQASGELLFGIGDMDVHSQITPEYISKFDEDLAMSSLVCLDGNISTEAIEYVCNLCSQHSVPVLYEPTDIHKAAKPFMTSAHRAVTYTSPNFNELKMMVSHLTGKQLPISGSADDLDYDTILHECTSLLETIANHIPVTIVTLGRHGVILCCHGDMKTKFPVKGDLIKMSGGLVMEYYQPNHQNMEPENIVSVSGAGDCMVSALVAGILQGHDPVTCMRSGLLAAQISLRSGDAVPPTLTPGKLTGVEIARGMNVTPVVLKTNV